MTAPIRPAPLVSACDCENERCEREQHHGQHDPSGCGKPAAHFVSSWGERSRLCERCTRVWEQSVPPAARDYLFRIPPAGHVVACVWLTRPNGDKDLVGWRPMLGLDAGAVWQAGAALFMGSPAGDVTRDVWVHR